MCVFIILLFATPNSQIIYIVYITHIYTISGISMNLFAL